MFLLLVAGLGGLLYGIDVGIIGGAYPYLEATSGGLTNGQLSVIVAAVLLGSVFSTLFAGLIADWMGRKPLMVLSGLTFVVSIPVIALSQGFWFLFFGRLLQGMSGGFIGIVVPLYLAECLSASHRGKGTGIFQWLLTLGIVAAAHWLESSSVIASQAVAAARWSNLPLPCCSSKTSPGAGSSGYRSLREFVFVLGVLLVTESPRWLFRRGKEAQALAPRCCDPAHRNRPTLNCRR